MRILTVLLIAYALFVHNLGNISLWDPDEPRQAIMAREMMDRSDYIHPYLNGIPYAEKPPLFSEVPALDKVPLAGHLLNRIITSPTHTKKYELMVLIRPTVPPVPEIKALAAQQQDRMPGIKAMETELRQEELKQLPAAERD